MDQHRQLETIIEEHLPQKLTPDQRDLVRDNIPRLVNQLLNIDNPVYGIVLNLVITSAVRNILNTFSVDFSDAEKLIQEILKKLREQKKP